MALPPHPNVATLFRLIDSPLRFADLIPEWAREGATIVTEHPGRCVFEIESEEGGLRMLTITQLYLTNPNMAPTTDIVDAAPEIMSCLYLSALRDGINFKTVNFPKLCSCNVVKDSFPFQMLPHWTKDSEHIWFRTDRGNHQFLPDPYDRNQMFLLIETNKCGEVLQVEDVSFALAVAESAFEFEHRDLHLDNLYLQDTKSKYLEYIVFGQHYWLQTFGVQAYITGFTMSRISYDNVVYYAQLKGVDSAGGDFRQWTDENSLSRNIYKHCKNDWASFRPYTNVLCLQHIFEQMCEYLINHISGTSGTMSSVRELSQKKPLSLLCKWRDEIVNYESVGSFVKNNILYCQQMNLIK